MSKEMITMELVTHDVNKEQLETCPVGSYSTS